MFATLAAELERLRAEAMRAAAESSSPEFRIGGFWMAQGVALCLERLYEMPKLTDSQAERARLCRDFDLKDTPEKGTTYRELCAFIAGNADRLAPKISPDRRTISAHATNAAGDHFLAAVTIFGICDASTVYANGLQITTRSGDDGNEENPATFAALASHAESVDPIKALLIATSHAPEGEEWKAEPFTFLFDHAAALEWGQDGKGDLIAYRMDAPGDGPAYGLAATLSRDGNAAVKISPRPPAKGSSFSTDTREPNTPQSANARQGCYNTLRAFAVLVAFLRRIENESETEAQAAA